MDKGMTEETIKERRKGKKLSKNVLNIIRTTMRNNIELTNIADNKANVLLSLNALMLTFLLPIVIANFDFIKSAHLGYSLICFVLTCLVTIYLSALALKPGNFKKLEKERGDEKLRSPFFFANYHKLKVADFEARIDEAFESDDMVRKHIMQDLYYIGARLGEKMDLIKSAFNFFLIGLILSILLAAFPMLFLNS